MDMAFNPAVHKVVSQHVPSKIAVLSVDVEYDYWGYAADALNRLPDFLAVVRNAGLPLTAFVEARLFGERPDLCTRLVETGVDVQLHCYDHREPGETVDSLRRGADAYERFTGTRPSGYRAPIYRLTEPLYRTLVADGFAWDSSILPGFGLGNQSARAFRSGDWFIIDDALAEFPVASWRTFGIPFTQSYRMLMGRFAEVLLDKVATLPKLLVYNLHMVDVVRDGRIGAVPMPLWLKGAHWLARHRQRGLDELLGLTERLRERGYEWTTLAQCHEQLWLRPAACARRESPNAPVAGSTSS